MSKKRIEINPAILGGKPVIRGTRISVELILRELAAGMTPEELVAEYPSLTLEDIYAAQNFAANNTRMSRESESLANFFNRSPLAGSNITIERLRDLPRDLIF